MVMLARRGGRARLKASDSKSDRGPEGPSGVQILSPPPTIEKLERRPPDRRAPEPCAGAPTAIQQGGVTERPKVRHWKCRARVIPVPRVQIPPPPPLISGVTVLDGELAVPCSPQSASAGSNSLSRAACVE